MWVLVPTVETTDPNLAYYNDFSQGEAEYARAFAALDTPWQWMPVTMANARAVLEPAGALAVAGAKAYVEQHFGTAEKPKPE